MLAYAVDPTDAPQSIYIWSRRGIASEEMSGDTKTKNGTTKVVGAMKWSLEVKHQNGRVYIHTLHKVHDLCMRLGMRQHISVAKADHAIILTSRDGVPITKQEMELIFDKAQEKVGITVVKFYQDSPTVGVDVDNGVKNENEPTPIGAHRRKEPPTTPLGASQKAEERTEAHETPKSELTLRMEELESRRIAERGNADDTARKEIDRIKDDARDKKRYLKENKKVREADTNTLRVKLDKIRDDVDSLVRMLQQTDILASVQYLTGLNIVSRKMTHTAIAFMALTAYRLGNEESKDVMSMLIQNIPDEPTISRVVRFFVERVPRAFKIEGTAMTGARWETELLVKAQKMLIKVNLSDKELLETTKVLRSVVLAATNKCIEDRAECERNYAKEHAKIEEERDNAIRAIQEKLPEALQEIENRFAEERLKLTAIPPRA